MPMKKLTIWLLLAVGAMACNKQEELAPEKESEQQETVDQKATEQQMALIMNSYANYDVVEAEALLCGPTLTLLADMRYDENWEEIMEVYYDFGTLLAAGLTVNSYTFHTDGTLLLQPGGSFADPLPAAKSGSWTFDPATRQLTLWGCSYEVVALGKGCLVWQRVEKSTSTLQDEKIPDSYFRSVYATR